MAKKTYGHQRGSDGKVHVVDETLPKRLRGHSEHFEGTVTEGPIKRLFGGKR